MQIITAVYAASDDGRTSDAAIGTQDEIDLEFKGASLNRGGLTMEAMLMWLSSC
jgi:hypothetical protein